MWARPSAWWLQPGREPVAGKWGEGREGRGRLGFGCTCRPCWRQEQSWPWACSREGGLLLLSTQPSSRLGEGVWPHLLVGPPHCPKSWLL